MLFQTFRNRWWSRRIRRTDTSITCRLNLPALKVELAVLVLEQAELPHKEVGEPPVEDHTSSR